MRRFPRSRSPERRRLEKEMKEMSRFSVIDPEVIEKIAGNARESLLMGAGKGDARLPGKILSKTINPKAIMGKKARDYAAGIVMAKDLADPGFGRKVIDLLSRRQEDFNRNFARGSYALRGMKKGEVRQIEDSERRGRRIFNKLDALLVKTRNPRNN